MTSKLVGNKTTRSTERYAHPALDNLQAGIRQSNENVKAKVKPAPAFQVVKGEGEP